MTQAKGFASSMAATVSSVWGTPVACGAGEQFEFVSESLTPDAQFIPDESLTGFATRLEGDKGNEFHNGDVVMDARYEGVGVFLAQALGTAGVPTQVGTDDAYTHLLLPADDKEGKHLTVAFDKQVGVWEYTTCKVGGFSFTCQNGNRGRFTFPIIPQGLNINTSSGTNNNTTKANWTLPSNRDFAKFSQMVVRINTQAGGALGDTDLVYVSGFECNLNNNYPTDDVTTQFGNLIDEPIQDGFTDVGGSLSFSRYHDTSPGGNDALISALLSKTAYKMDVVLTGPVADGSANFSLTFTFPAVQFSSGDANISGPGRVPVNLQFSAARVSTAPTGFTSTHVHGVNVELVNQVATDLLA